MRKMGFFLIAAVAFLPALASGQSSNPSNAPAAAMAPEAKDYLDGAIALFQEQHINAAKMDWPALTQTAYAAAAGAKTTADTYPAIRMIIDALGEKHTFFSDPDHARAQNTGKASGNVKPPAMLLPEGFRLASGIGVIRLYSFIGSPEAEKLYAQTAKSKINEMKAHGVCRFVLDLREDRGGDMYPMLGGVSGLLEPGVLGVFEDRQGRYNPWVLKNGEVTQLPLQSARPKGSAGNHPFPVAVLIGPQTASSGEFTAMSFEGRANTRFFGAPSGGFVTANEPVPLPDGAQIAMTTAWGLDRTGRKYVDRIEPDENTGSGGLAFDAAVKWLSAQHCPPRAMGAGSAKHR